MHRLRTSLPVVIPILLVIVVSGTAFAQGLEPPPAPAKGFCAPWHKCLAIATLGMAVLGCAALFLGYLLQRRGFDRIEHRQGNPEGVNVER